MASVSVSIRCGGCGVALGWPDGCADSFEIRCPNCGESAGTYGEFCAEAEEAVAAKIEAIFNGNND
jgi:hypothetical protein